LELGGSSRLQDAALAHLKPLTELRELSLHKAPIGDVGLAHLAALTSLKELDVRGTKVTAAGIAKLEVALPLCKVLSDHATADPDRAAAKWAISRGGIASVLSVGTRNVQDITQFADLPPGPFNLMHVEFNGKPITDEELAVLRGLKRLSGVTLRLSDSSISRRWKAWACC
jgi:hypothetical protein